jgi:hypothetical protein
MSGLSRIVEKCACGAVLDFQCRSHMTRDQQDRADQDFLSRFRTEHVCTKRSTQPGDLRPAECTSEDVFWEFHPDLGGWVERRGEPS